ncbi:alpha/beta hydrolase [Defluviimonas sp. WL0024]|uniref:Alpha/beta hydrolase n=1 Tax=Albidovulum salinarum TaxID=2984153 RepID=A0ABT2X0K3_9RHOB|nr:alpha/beta hydrolase [Defluviimonas sp. WL0024]MCU9847458.1 alpha/beta hydrolase [Defluviimonas sp. WL0024]
MRYDDAYANAKFIPGGADYPPRWAKGAATFRAALGQRARLGLRYGPAEAGWFDLFLPDAEPLGLMVFVHGGYWLAFGPRDFSHLASGALARGWACAMPAYTLAPKARISEMTAEIAAALPMMAGAVAGPVVLTGHSAGGHLAARMASADAALPVVERLTRIVPISPLADLRPLIETAMNADLRLDQAEARDESPALHPRRPGTSVHVWVGGDERPAFLDQARRLGNAWACPVTIEPKRHHFDVIEGLKPPDSPLMAALLG